MRRQLKGIDWHDLSTAEKNILVHLDRKDLDPTEIRNRIAQELAHIDYADMTTAERNIRNLVGTPLTGIEH